VVTALIIWITDVDASDDAIDSEEVIAKRKEQSYKTLYLITALSFCAFIFAIFVKEDLRRVNYKANQDKQENIEKGSGYQGANMLNDQDETLNESDSKLTSSLINESSLQTIN
jgi:hypothetical protein